MQVAELPLNLSRDVVARGIIHLPVPVKVGPLTGTFCSPFKHKVPSEWNRVGKCFHSPLSISEDLSREREITLAYGESITKAQRERAKECKRERTQKKKNTSNFHLSERGLNGRQIDCLIWLEKVDL